MGFAATVNDPGVRAGGTVRAPPADARERVPSPQCCGVARGAGAGGARHAELGAGGASNRGEGEMLDPPAPGLLRLGETQQAVIIMPEGFSEPGVALNEGANSSLITAAERAEALDARR